MLYGYAATDMNFDDWHIQANSQATAKLSNSRRRQESTSCLKVLYCQDRRRFGSTIAQNDIGADATIQTVSDGISKTKALLNPMSTDAWNIEITKHCCRCRVHLNTVSRATAFTND